MGMTFNNYPIRGIDVSGYNNDPYTTKNLDIQKAVDLGIKFICVRGTYGITTDWSFKTTWADAKGKVLRVVYAYLDYYSNDAKGISDANWGKMQAQAVWNLIKDDNDGTPVFLDIEKASFAAPVESVLPKVTRIANAFLAEMDRLTGKLTGVYFSLSYLKHFLGTKHRPLWLAWYNEYVTIPNVIKSVRAEGWTGTIPFWQYASDGDIDNDGVGDGIRMGMEAKALDLDIWIDTPEAFANFGKVTVTLPEPPNTLNIQPFSQQDPRWKDIRFGDTTIGANGCLISDIAMMLKYLGLDTDPARLVAWLKSNGGLYGNLFVWKSVEKLLPGLKFILKYIGSHPDKIDESLSRKMPCLVHVDYDPTTSLIDQHWILIVDKVDGRYVAIDPKDGVRIWFDERYGSSTGNIYNVSTYSFSTTPEPPPIQIPQTSSYEIGKTLVNGQNMRYGPGAANLIIGKINAGIQLPLLAYAKDIYGNPWIRIGHNQWIAQQIRTTKFVERVYVK